MAARHQPAKSLLFAEFCKKFPDLRQNPGETRSQMTAFADGAHAKRRNQVVD